MIHILQITVFLIICGGLCAATQNQYDKQNQWRDFKIKFKRNYNESENEKRFKIFEENCLKVEKHNKLEEEGKETFRIEVNRYGDMTFEEIIRLHTPEKLNFSSDYEILTPKDFKLPEILDLDDDFVVPDSFDWREKGAVSSVKDQLPCGSCWAHAAVACIESQYYIEKGKMLDFSEQELVDCVAENYGCDGGDPSFTYNYLMKHSLSLEKDYPYTAKNGTCKENVVKSEVRLASYAKLDREDEILMKKAVAEFGPVEVSISFIFENFMRYKDGVYYDKECDGKDLNHAVTIVGYGTDAKTKMDYWIVKNSWGKHWGENGFFRIARNKNHCGIAELVFLPLLKAQSYKFGLSFLLAFGVICLAAAVFILGALCYLIYQQNTSNNDEDYFFDDGNTEEINKELIVFSYGKDNLMKEEYI